MPPWRTSRGLVLSLLTCLSVTLATAESVAAPAQGDEADILPAQRLNTAAAPGEGAATPWVITPKRTMTVTPQSDVLTKKASVVEQGPKKASVVEQSPKKASEVEPGLKKASVVEQSPKKASVVEQGPKKASVVEQGPKKASVVEQGPKKASVVEQGPKKASVVEPGPKKASPKRLSRELHSVGNNKKKEQVKVDRPSQPSGLVVVLVLLLLALLVTLTGAWCKLREYGGTGAYYPWRMETGVRGPPGWVRTLRSFLPGRASSQGADPEAEDQKIVDEEDEGEDEEDEEEPGSEDEEPRSEDEEEEEGGSKLRREGDSLSDYSSLGGIDLRERAGAAGGEDEESLPPPSSSPRGSQVLGGLHSLAGSAPWGETGQDVTAL